MKCWRSACSVCGSFMWKSRWKSSCMCWITLSSSQRGCWLRSSAWCHVCKCHHLTPLKYTPVVTVARCKFVRVTCWEALKPFLLSESVVGCVSCVMVSAVCLFVFRCYAFQYLTQKYTTVKCMRNKMQRVLMYSAKNYCMFYYSIMSGRFWSTL